MKRYFLISCFLLLTTFTYAQQWDWAKKIDNLDSYSQLKIYPSGNIGFYLTGRYNNTLSIDGHTISSSGLSYFIGRFNVSGQCIWLKNCFNIHDACIDLVGNIYLAGVFSGQITIENNTLHTIHNNAGIIAKYTSSGNLSNVEKLDGNNARCRIKSNSQSQLIVCTSYSDSLNYKGSSFKDSAVVILKLDLALNMLQSIQTATFSSIVQIDIGTNDTIYMVANKDYPCMYCGVTKLMKFSPDLTLLIDHFYASGVGSHYYEEPIITTHSDGNIYVMQPTTYSNSTGKKYSSELDQIGIKQLEWRGSLYSKNNKLFAIGASWAMNCMIQ